MLSYRYTASVRDLIREPTNSTHHFRLSSSVHHGGAGTTAAAAKVGLSQVIIPLEDHYDQRFWGKRMLGLGVGVYLDIMRAQNNSHEKTFLECLSAAMRAAKTKGVAARRLAEELQMERERLGDPIKVAVDLVKKHFL